MINMEKYITDSFMESFDGLMLGDGCVSKSKVYKNYRYTQDCKYHEWLDCIKNLFFTNGFKSDIYVTKAYGDRKPNSSYNLNSSSIGFFTEQHKRWYIKDYNIDEYPTRLWHLDEDTGEYFAWHKTIPIDIILTPECVLNWYLGDGGLYKQTYRKSYFIQIATCGFTEREVEHLIFLLNDQVVDCAHYIRSSNTIQISKKSGVNMFLDYLGNLNKPNCYAYKFQDKLAN